MWNDRKKTPSPFLPMLPLMLLCLLAAPGAQEGFPEGARGEAAIAARYLLRAEEALGRDDFAEAEIVLERARDYAAASSDLSLCLALARRALGRPTGLVLEAAREGLEAGRWSRYGEGLARLVEADALIRLRDWSGALAALARIRPPAEALVPPPFFRIDGANAGAAASCLRLRAFLGMGDLPAFRREMRRALDLYPQESAPLRLFFGHAAANPPAGDDPPLLDRVMEKLPWLLEADPDLAWMAVPCVRDVGEARRLVSAWRAGGGRNPAALPAALDLGVVGGEEATAELFGGPGELDLRLLRSVRDLLRSGAERETFRRNLSSFSGVITEDPDGDGYPESWAAYLGGELRSFRLDPDQDGIARTEIDFAAGSPRRALAVISPAEGGGGEVLAEILWEPYPWVREARIGKVRYRYLPAGFPFAPLKFTWAEGLLLPVPDAGQGRLSGRALVMDASEMERPSLEFPGGVEVIRLRRGIPEMGLDMVDGRIVSATVYRGGRKESQQIDLDMDGRMETIRFFRPGGSLAAGGDDPFPLESPSVLASSMSDWDGDDIYETWEEYRPDGTIRSWDVDRDGIREYLERHDE